MGAKGRFVSTLSSLFAVNVMELLYTNNPLIPSQRHLANIVFYCHLSRIQYQPSSSAALWTEIGKARFKFRADRLQCWKGPWLSKF